MPYLSFPETAYKTPEHTDVGHREIIYLFGTGHDGTVIPVFRSLGQEDQKFKASLGYIMRLYLKKQNNPN
jgi:hypothetical protein